jgi:hypothetical protein
MRILMTGMTRRQANHVSTRSKQDYLSAPIIFYNIIKQIKNFKVDWRPVSYGEDLRMYDLILIGLSAPNSLSNIFLFQSIWATQFPHLFFVDDFKVKGAFGGYDVDNLFRNFTFDRQKLSADERVGLKRTRNMKSIVKLSDNIIEASSLLAPMFEWGDHSLLVEGTPIRKNGLQYIDPSPFITNNEFKDIIKMEKKWICPALYDYEDKLNRWNIAWPVDYYHKKNYISEAVLARRCEEAYGILSPKYSHAGSGWWRNRFNMAINTNSLILAHHDEVVDLGKIYCSLLENIDKIESMTHKQLADLIIEQRDAFFAQMESKKYNIKKMESIIYEARER